MILFFRIFVAERVAIAESAALESANVAGTAAGVDLGTVEELQKCDGVADYQGWHSDHHDHFAE